MPPARVSVAAALVVLATAGVVGAAQRPIRATAATPSNELPSAGGGLVFEGVSAFSPAPGARAAVARSVARAYARQPLSFEPNRGQAGRRARFLARGGRYTVSLTGSGALLSLARGEGKRPAVLRLGFAGVSARARLTAVDRLPGKVNYLLGKDRSRWHANVPTYSKVRHRNLYPGVDGLYYGRGGRLEYDLVLAPHADAEQILLRFGGAKPRVAGNGDLILRTGGETIRQLRPAAFQRVGGSRRAVRSRYEMQGGRGVGIRLGRYDSARPLVIDPVLVYSTYLGGSGDDQGHGIAVDAAGNAYVTGSTGSSNFPRQDALQGTYGGNVNDAFVTKFDPSGSTLVYSTFLGGGAGDNAHAIRVDGAGNAYVAGITGSSDFPTANPLQAMIGGGADAFLTKLNPAGSALVYSTFLGGTGSDQGLALAIDGAQNAYVTGITGSPNFPTANALQGMLGGADDAFLTKFNAGGNALVYSTYLGGSVHDAGTAIALDGSNNAHVIGETSSTNFPTANAVQAMNGGLSDAFISKLNAPGSALVYSTYHGGSADEYGVGAAVDGTGAYVTGYTESTNFPTAAPAQPMPGGLGDAFVTKLNPSGGAYLYSTYLGGSGIETAQGIAVDGAGDAHVTGLTRSTNFPVAAAFQAMSGTGDDAFVTRFNAGGSAHVYSSYLGGTGDERGYGIAVGSAGTAYVTGGTESANFPLLQSRQTDPGGGEDAFVTKIGEAPSLLPPLDTTAAALSRLKLSPAVFRAASRGAGIGARTHRVGSRVSYRLSEAATVSFRVQRAAAGRRVGGRCRRPTRANRPRPRCARYVLLKGSLRHAGSAGSNRFRFTGRLRGRKLGPAAYRLRARSVDAAGNTSPFVRKRFRIVRR